MATNYDRGRAAEYRAKQKLEEQGFTVFRTAGSKSPCDLIALKPHTPIYWGDASGRIRYAPVFVQVKSGVRPMPRAEKARFKDFAVEHGARPLLIERGNQWTWLDEQIEAAA